MAKISEQNRTIGSLKKRADFLRVQQEGKKWVTQSFIIRQLDQPKDQLCETDIRFGLTVTKRLFKNATDRNRVKRRLRAMAQDILLEVGQDKTDYVLIGRTETLTRDFSDLQKDLKWALKRLSQS
ncbi:MAG: ribonuclease P protein component [Bdellovibrionales bacterium]